MITTEQILRTKIQRLRATAATYRQQADDRDKLADEYQRELDTLLLAAYWEAHKNLTPVQVGDKIVITQEYLGYMHVQTWLTVNQTVTIDRISSGYNGSFWFTVEEFKGVIPIELVQGMRQDYLAQQQQQAT